MKRAKGKTYIALLLGILATVVLTLLVRNLLSGKEQIERRIAPAYGVGDPQFVRSMGSLLGPSILDGNRVVGLRNGDEIFPAMLEAIRSAERTITFETYIYWSGEIGREFGDALSERSRAGVKIHVLLDWVGSGKMDKNILAEMESNGVEVRKYHPPHWYTLSRMNNRTHRKLLVVDGRVGFTGGVGIADKWRGHAQDAEHWRDSHYRLEGPAVAQMQAAFMDNWMEITGNVLDGEEYFPELQQAGTAPAQMFKSSSQEGSESVQLMYLLSIASARRTLRIASAYFVPDDLSIETLVRAAKRGVRTELIVPGPIIDSKIVQKASRSRWGDLLEAGVEIYEYQPTMFHCKIMIVDDLWISVGSTNFDDRSFRLNDEANLNVLDHDLALGQIRDFEEDKRYANRVTLQQWQRRPWKEKILEKLSGLLRKQL